MTTTLFALYLQVFPFPWVEVGVDEYRVQAEPDGSYECDPDAVVLEESCDRVPGRHLSS